MRCVTKSLKGEEKSVKHLMGVYCSVYLVDILAIKEVPDWLRCNIQAIVGINIFSDSASIICFPSNISWTQDLPKTVANLKARCRTKIHTIWVPGHQDIPGNCRADALARQGITLQAPEEMESVDMTRATAKLILLDRVSKNTDENSFPTDANSSTDVGNITGLSYCV